eukprot:216890_1
MDPTRDPTLNCDPTANRCCDVQKWIHPYDKSRGYYLFCNPHFMQSYEDRHRYDVWSELYTEKPKYTLLFKEKECYPTAHSTLDKDQCDPFKGNFTKIRAWFQQQLNIPLEFKHTWTMFTISGSIINTFEEFISLMRSSQLWQIWLNKEEAICPSIPQIYYNRDW